MTNETGSHPRRRAVLASTGLQVLRRRGRGGRRRLPRSRRAGGERRAAAAAGTGGILSTAPPAAAPRTPSTPTVRSRTPTSRAASSSTSRCSTGTTTTSVAVRASPSRWSRRPTPQTGRSSCARASPSTTARTSPPRTCCSPSTGWPAKAPTSAGVALAPIIDFNATKKVDDTTVVIKLKTPYAVLDYLLAEYTLGIVPARLRPEEPGRHRPVQVQVVQPRQEQRLHEVRRLLGRARPTSTSCTSRTSPTPAPRSTRSRPARCRRSTTCPTT